MEPTPEMNGAPTELPTPVSQENTAEKTEAHAAQEQPAENAGLASAKAAPSSSAPHTDVSSQSLPSGSSAQNNDTTVSATTDDDLMADDADLIEKEWIVRAKSVVEQTKFDPHAQNHELSKVKAEYIKKRYNKDIKANEG